MKKRFSEDQIHKILKESESGASTSDVCRKYGISGNTFYRWRSKYGGLELSDLKRMKTLEEENSKLKKLYAELALENEAIKDVTRKKVVSREQKREAVMLIKTKLGERKSCRLLQISRTVFRYRCGLQDKNKELKDRIRSLAYKHRRAGYRQIHSFIRQGEHVNHKRIYRLYSELGLKYRIKRKRKRLSLPTVPKIVPKKSEERWSMDFMSDSLYSGRRFRILNIIDDFGRFAVVTKAEFSITSERLVRILNEVSEVRSLPKQIVVDNGPEFTSKTFLRWAFEKRVDIHFITPGKPTENAFIESFNGKMRNECLNENWFKDIEEARRLIEEWRIFYNSERPHSSLGGLTPEEYLRRSA
ncbi:IS3 family transposase [Leptospira weilii]|nr:IS3 family transposase [Leptospira weilii]MCL8268730.1 IS3 family transposase [Leptospira weilii]